MTNFEIRPFGARIFVEDLEPETSLAKRAEAAGLHLVVLDSNNPKPTTGRVIAIGDDPFIQERIKLGDVVSFKWSAGMFQQVEGKQYRCLEDREIISVIRKTGLVGSATPLSEPDSPDLAGPPCPTADPQSTHAEPSTSQSHSAPSLEPPTPDSQQE